MTEPLVTYLELVVWAESECTRIDIWEDVLRAEGKFLDAGQAYYRRRARKAAQILEMVWRNHEDFEDMVRASRNQMADNAARGRAKKSVR